jgi:phosphate:Na+ symporter
MLQLHDIWKILAGVAIFLLGIRFLEDSLQQLAGRKFKLFLKKYTTNKLRAISGGAIVTAVLQSSSLVSLMVLAFTGAGIITMQNALAVILGANLGTTLDSWIVALAGFKINIENFSLPVAGIAGLGFAIFNKQSKWYNRSRFLLGFSFLFIGLGYMKSGIEDLVKNTDLRQYEQLPIMVFVLIGFVITSLIQSSSATIAITLSALHAGAVSLPGSMAIVLGSEIGTTIKLFVASINSIAAKKRVALGNFIFNLVAVLLVLIFLRPVSRFITDIAGIKDNLIALVFFQSLVNITGIILFYPLLNVFGKFLESRFRTADDETIYIHKVNAAEPATALDALENETRHFSFAVLDYAMNLFDIKNLREKDMLLGEKYLSHSLAGKYQYIKFLYGEIHSFYIGLRRSTEHKDDLEKLERLVSAVRNAMYAAKNFKDAIPDIDQLRNSVNDIKFEFYKQTRESVSHFSEKITRLLLTGAAPVDELAIAYQGITDGYTATLKQLYRQNTAGFISEIEITTLLNFNREIFTAFKSLFFSAKDFLLDREQSRYFDELPGFIR